jgi:hypothetical protein
MSTKRTQLQASLADLAAKRRRIAAPLEEKLAQDVAAATAEVAAEETALRAQLAVEDATCIWCIRVTPKWNKDHPIPMAHRASSHYFQSVILLPILPWQHVLCGTCTRRMHSGVPKRQHYGSNSVSRDTMHRLTVGMRHGYPA